MEGVPVTRGGGYSDTFLHRSLCRESHSVRKF